MIRSLDCMSNIALALALVSVAALLDAHELTERFIFGLTVKLGPCLTGVPKNKDEIIALMKEALFVRVPQKPRLLVAPSKVTMDELDYESTMAPVYHSGRLRRERTKTKQEDSVECLRILNNAIVAAHR
jgi:hypothetical protein